MLPYNDRTVAIIGIGLSGIIFARVAWMYSPAFLRGLLNCADSTPTHSDEKVHLINPTTTLTLDLEKMKDVTLNNATSFLITKKMLSSLQILGLNSSCNSSLSLCTLQTQYRKKLRETHPDKTRENTLDSFIAVREALKVILHELSSTNLDLDFQNLLFEFGLNELFSIFIAKNDLMKKRIAQELLGWQQLREISKGIIEKQYQCMQAQETTLTRLQQTTNAMKTLQYRSEQLTVEKLALKTVLEKYENGELTLSKITSLFQAADKFNGLTKIPGYGKIDPNPYGFFENSSIASDKTEFKVLDSNSKYQIETKIVPS